MRRMFLPIFLWAGLLSAEDAAERPKARVGLGIFTDRYSDATGTRNGWNLGGEWFRDDKGPWSFSAVGTQRPEGKATQFTVAKEHAFGESSWVWVGLAGSAGEDYLPRFRGDVDLNLGLSGPWGLGLEAAWNKFRDGGSVTVLQAGPSWVGEVWIASARVQQVRYQPGSESDRGYLTDLRWGAHNLRQWHSLRIAWGQGIIDSLQPDSVASTTISSAGSGRGRHAAGTLTTGLLAPKLNEFLVSSASHLPVSRRFALRVDLAWGQRETQFKLWSVGLQTLVTF